MKKKLALILAAVLMFATLTGCGNKTTPPASAGSTGSASASTAEPMASDLKVGVFYYDFSDIYISSVRNNVDTQLTALVGKNFQNYDGGADQAKQTDQINTAITDGVNLLIVNIVETSSPDAAQNAVEAARAAGIPIIFFNREVADEVVNSYDKCAFVGTDAPEAGHLQGELVGQYVLDNYDAVDLNKDGKISYVMFKGQEGNAEAEARTQFGVEDADKKLTEAGKPALEFYDAKNASKYLVDQGGKWSAEASTNYMNTILSEYSEGNKNMIELVICNNDGMAEGAVSALQTAGYNLGNDEDGKPTSTVIPVFGVDATDSAKQLINEGKMTGTIKQDAEGMATTICALVANVQSGAAVMDKIDEANGYNVDKNDDGTMKVAKIRVPYGTYTGE